MKVIQHLLQLFCCLFVCMTITDKSKIFKRLTLFHNYIVSFINTSATSFLNVSASVKTRQGTSRINQFYYIRINLP